MFYTLYRTILVLLCDGRWILFDHPHGRQERVVHLPTSFWTDYSNVITRLFSSESVRTHMRCELKRLKKTPSIAPYSLRAKQLLPDFCIFLDVLICVFMRSKISTEHRENHQKKHSEKHPAIWSFVNRSVHTLCMRWSFWNSSQGPKMFIHLSIYPLALKNFIDFFFYKILYTEDNWRPVCTKWVLSPTSGRIIPTEWCRVRVFQRNGVVFGPRDSETEGKFKMALKDNGAWTETDPHES